MTYKRKRYFLFVMNLITWTKRNVDNGRRLMFCETVHWFCFVEKTDRNVTLNIEKYVMCMQGPYELQTH